MNFKAAQDFRFLMKRHVLLLFYIFNILYVVFALARQ